MAKKKKRRTPGGGGNKKKKKDNPLSLLLQEHPDLDRDLAKEIVDAGMTYEEWQDEQERIREERKRKKLEQIISFVCSQHPDLSREQATQIAERGITPEEFKQELREKLRRERRQSRGRGGARGGGGHRGGHRGGGGQRGFRRGGKGGGKPPGRKQVAKKRVSKKKQMRKEAVDAIMSKFPDLDDRAVAGQIASGRLTYEQYLENKNRPKVRRRRPSHRSEEEHNRAIQLREERNKALQERVERESHLGKTGDSYLKERIDDGQAIRILRFHKPAFIGVLTEVEPFRLFLQTETNPKLTLTKRFCSAILEDGDWESIASQLLVSLPQRAMRQIPHHEPKMRYVVPDDLLEDGAPLSVLMHEGLLVNGTIVWSDRFQVLLSLPDGGNIFIFRHAIHRAAEDSAEWDADSVPYLEFSDEGTDLPEVHPGELKVDDVYVPVQFNDYSVEDQVYQKYSDAYDKGNFKFDPLYVRREGDSYVLVDGYRRWALAKEKGEVSIPITVI